MMRCKRLLAMLLALLMVIPMFPTAVLADEIYEGVPSAKVMLSLSRDAEFMVGPETGEVMAMKEITVPYFDLANYGLEEYYFQSETYGDDGDGIPGSDLTPGTAEYAYGKVTLLHLYIYALEVFYCGIDEAEAGQGYLYDQGLIGTDVFTISGGVGSSFLNQFWGGDCNLNYYVNYVYPLASDGWGATADQILLREGDIVTLGHFSGWSFYGDPASIFNYIKVGDEVGQITVKQGDQVTLSLMCAGPNMGTSTDTAQNPVTYSPDVYYTSLDDGFEADVTSWEYIGYADENGELVFDTTDLEAGEYLVCLPGQYGQDYTDEICSTPGGIKLIVESAQCAHNEWNDATCTAPKTCAGCGETEGEPLGHDWSNKDGDCVRCDVFCTDHTYENGECSICGMAEPCRHTVWNDATCIAPKTCDKCGETEGEPLGHDWSNKDGDCVRCDVFCADHTYENGECSICGMAEPVEIPETVDAVTIKVANDAKSGKVKVTWNASENAVKYDIYRSVYQKGEFTKIDTVTDISYLDNSAKAGTKYTYYVVAVSESGVESANSNKLYITSDLAQPVVTASSAAKSGKPMLSWKKIEGAQKYQIYRSTSKNGKYTLMKTVTGTTYTNTNAKAGKIYYYKVKAIHSNSNANSVFSEIDQRTCDLPRPDVSIKLKNGDPRLSWEKITGATKYQVYRATSKNGKYYLMKTVTGTTYTNASAKAGKTYYYKVKAIHSNTNANSAFSLVDSIKAK